MLASTHTRIRSLHLKFHAWLLAWLTLGSCAVADEPESVQSRFDLAVGHYDRGDFESAAMLWREVETSAGADAKLRLRAQLGVAAACQNQGLYEQGLRVLRDAKPLLSAAADDGLTLQYEQRIGNLLLADQQLPDALQTLDNAAIRANAYPKLHASLLNDLGNALASQGRISEALTAHRQSLTLAQDNSLDALTVAAAINIVRLQVQSRDFDSARAMLDVAARGLEVAHPSFERALAFISLSELEQHIEEASASQVDSRREQWLSAVQEYAAMIDNERLASLAAGHQGVQQSGRGDVVGAESQLRRAVFLAAQARAEDLTYLWRWRLGEVLLRQHRLREAVEELQRALVILTPIRRELMKGYRDPQAFFQAQVKPVYMDLVDALLLDAAGAEDADRQRLLGQARATIEQLKSAELQDYFGDECVTAQEALAVPLDQTARDAAVLYPMMLPDRLELLVQIGGHLYQYTVSVDQHRLTDHALRLRELIEQPGNSRFLPYAQRLYRWLIAPAVPLLERARVTTLVVVPDGALRVLPFAVLHDGDDYLVRRFAIAVTPSLTLTDPRPLSAARPLALMAGVARSVQGFMPLPHVTSELSSIRPHVRGTVLSDENYTVLKLSAALASTEYAIVHIATHSMVGETPAESFMLTYDGKLTMSDLERLLRQGRFRRHPVELLTLSACETAFGDERAALGLAGIAVKSGARSAVATLWRVPDEASARVMSGFYEALAASDRPSKAAALQSAQWRVLRDSGTSHPAYWAAFMLIGNWL